jgi:hypothetical protein
MGAFSVCSITHGTTIPNIANTGSLPPGLNFKLYDPQALADATELTTFFQPLLVANPLFAELNAIRANFDPSSLTPGKVYWAQAHFADRPYQILGQIKFIPQEAPQISTVVPNTPVVIVSTPTPVIDASATPGNGAQPTAEPPTNPPPQDTPVPQPTSEPPTQPPATQPPEPTNPPPPTEPGWTPQP